MRNRSVTVLAGLVLLACSPRSEQARSGTRLKARFLQARGDERAVRFEAFQDLEQGVDCRPAALSDGGLNCLPKTAIGFDDGYFADARCTEPAYRTFDALTCTGCDERFVRIQLPVRCGPDPEAPTVEVRRVLGVVQSPGVYRREPGLACVEVTRPASGALLRTEPLPAGTFVEFSVEKGEPRGALVPRRARSPDGAEVVVGPVTREGAALQPEEVCQAERRWLPVPQTVVTEGYADATCETRVAYAFCGPEARHAQGDTHDACEAKTAARYRVGDPVSASYSRMGELCIASAGSAPLGLIATPIPDEDFEPALALSLGSGRLKATGWTDARGGVLAPGLEFFDGLHGWTCVAANTRAEGLRCLPRVEPVTLGPVSYRDPGCSEPVWVAETTRAALRASDGTGQVNLYKVLARDVTWRVLYSRSLMGGGCAVSQESAVDGKAFRLELLPDESFAPMAEVMD